jgi:hypothetical protein
LTRTEELEGKKEVVMRKVTRVRLFCILVGSILAAFLVPLAARAWLASPRPVEAPVMAAAWPLDVLQISDHTDYDVGVYPYPALAAQSPDVCAVWSGQVGSGEKDYDPYYTSSDGDGAFAFPGPMTWGGRFNISSTLPITKETSRVDVAVDSGGGFHFVWSEYTVTPSYTLYYSSTYDTNILTIAAADVKGMVPAIAVGSSKVHVVWSQGTSSIEYKSKLIGSGESWGSYQNIASASQVMQPDIAVDGADIAHVVWSEGDIGSADIFYRNSSGGWSTAPFEVSSGLSNDGREPAITVSGDDVYVVWCESTADLNNQWVRFRKSTSGSWSPSSDPISGDALSAHAHISTWLCPAVTVDISGTLHVAFNGLVPGGTYEDVYYVYKMQDGTWRSRQNLTQKIQEFRPWDNTTPDIAASGEYVHLVWAGPRLKPGNSDYEVLYKRKSIKIEKGDVYLPLIMKSS